MFDENNSKGLEELENLPERITISTLFWMFLTERTASL